MSTSRPRDPKFLDRTNGQETAHGSSSTPYPADTADWSLADPTDSQSHSEGAHIQDPFAYYKAFLTSDLPSSSHTNNLVSDGDGCTGDTVRMGAQYAQGNGAQPHCRPRALPQNLAVRFASHSNGAPLATIIEQGSASTLNSHGSLLSVRRFPSIRAVENVSPGSASHRTSKSLDDKALKDIQEEARQDDDMRSISHAVDVESGERRGGSEPLREPATPAQFSTPQFQSSEEPQLLDVGQMFEAKGLKGFFRGVLQNVRAGSRMRSRSSSMTNMPQSHGPKEVRDGKDFDPRTLRESQSPEMVETRRLELRSSINAKDSGSISQPHAAPDAQVRGRQSLRRNSEPSAAVSPPILRRPPPTLSLDSGTHTFPHLLPLPDLSRLRNGRELLLSARPVPPEPRDGTQNQTRTEATTFSRRSKDELSAQRVLNSVPVYGHDAASLRENDRARDSSRNPSFCSTQSTSYSGTVLGVDLDLQHDFSHPARRSVTPVWFSRQEGRTDFEERTKSIGEQRETKQLLPRSVTSSALSSLLPIAAAEGIIKPNFRMPQLSFFSPSGNLIQADDSPPLSTSPSRSNSYCPGTPTTSTSYYNNTGVSAAHDTLSEFISHPPARPASVPLTTPPQSTAPLPDHLRHHHNYHQAEKSQINPDSESESHSEPQTRTIITPGPAVKGCGGVVRPDSPNPRSGIRSSPAKSQKKTRYGHSMSCLPNSEANRSRFSLLPSWPSPQKGRTLKKRPPREQKAGSIPSVGPVAGHALRVCFCQPYDGAGKRSADISCRSVTDQRHDEAYAREARDTETPNVRIIDSTPSPNGNKDKADNRKGRARSDSAVSMGIRVVAVGG